MQGPKALASRLARCAPGDSIQDLRVFLVFALAGGDFLAFDLPFVLAFVLAAAGFGEVVRGFAASLRMAVCN